MAVVAVALKHAERTKRILLEKGLLDNAYRFSADKKKMYFAVSDKNKASMMLKGITHSFVTKKLMKHEKVETDFKVALASVLTKKELLSVKTAYDIIGTIAILEIDEGLRGKGKKIAAVLLKINNRIKTVLRKAGIHGGDFRTQEMEFLGGVDTRETVHKENNVSLQLDVEKVYFSPRLSTERRRVMELVKRNEEILVMFSGCAPYPCVLAKNTDAKMIFGVELNPVGHRYGLVNLALNKLKNVELVNGDAGKVVLKLGRKFDRIVMPLPKSADAFLPVALSVCRKNGVIHFYDFQNEDSFALAAQKVEKACVAAGRRCKILRMVKCGHHAPHVFRVCVDAEIL